MKNDRLYRWIAAATKTERATVAATAGISVKYLIDVSRAIKDGAKFFPVPTARRILDGILCAQAGGEVDRLPIVELRHIVDTDNCILSQDEHLPG